MKVVQIISGGYGFRAKAGAPTKLILAGSFALMMQRRNAL